MSGVLRPGSQGGRPGTVDGALRTPRTARTARPVSAASGRHVRLGTASMLSQKVGVILKLERTGKKRVDVLCIPFHVKAEYEKFDSKSFFCVCATDDL